ncbi:MAG: DUF1566 domain-containing protein [Bacteroidales bacterium]|nr:DUF1566 domain-containing protein [Bacteroidales bacterium]
MKTKNIFKTLVLAAVLVSACGKNEIADDFKGYTLPVTINVTRQGDDATKATYNESTRKLEFSAGDKLFVEGRDNNTAGSFKGVLTWVSGGTFSGSINTEKEYTGTADALLTDAAYVTATLLPAGYESYAFLSIEDETDCSGWVGMDLSKAFAPTKKAAVEQFSYERATSYSSGFALSPDNAIVSFTISGLAANTEVAVLFKDAYDTEATPVNVTTDASGVATFAVAVYYNDNIDYYTLTVDGIDITLPDKTAEKGHIYNISRSVAPAGPTAYTLAESTVGMIVGTDGKAYAAADKDNLPTGVTAVAIIAYVGSATGEASPYNHGLAIAMKDAAAGGKVKWSSSDNDESLTNYTDYSPAVTTAQSGLSNSQTSGFDNESNYPAFYAALHNTITVSDGISAVAPASGTSGWFLPSLYQWNKIVQGLSGKTADLSHGGNANNNYTASSLNPKIEAAGGTGLQSNAYWPSTEYSSPSAWYFYTGNGSVGYRNKTGESYVRAVLAF